MSGAVIEKQSTDALGTKISRSLNIVMEWQEIVLPSRFALASGDLRRLAIRVREQPVNFMFILQQSLSTAKNGQAQCRRGKDASLVLLGEGVSQNSAQEKTEFTTITLQEIKKYASELNDHTKATKENFRVLRTTVLEVYKELKGVTDKRDRPDFFVRLSRYLSNYVRDCEGALRQVCEDLAGIESTLDLIIHWWQKVESDANYLLMNGESSLKLQQNRIILNKIKGSFETLEKYFAEYLDKMSLIYDDNFTLLNPNNKKCVTDAQNRPQDRPGPGLVMPNRPQLASQGAR